MHEQGRLALKIGTNNNVHVFYAIQSKNKTRATAAKTQLDFSDEKIVLRKVNLPHLPG